MECAEKPVKMSREIADTDHTTKLRRHFWAELNAVYSIDKELLLHLPNLIQLASPPLSLALEVHLEHKQQQLFRLEGIFLALWEHLSNQDTPEVQRSLNTVTERCTGPDNTQNDALIIACLQQIGSIENSHYGELIPLCPTLEIEKILYYLEKNVEENNQFGSTLARLS